LARDVHDRGLFAGFGAPAPPGAQAIASDHPPKATRPPIERAIILFVAALLTVATIASELGVSQRWVHARIVSGELRAIRGIG
jgi:hypothetical protein